MPNNEDGVTTSAYQNIDHLVGYRDPKLIIKILEGEGSLADERFLRDHPIADIDPNTLELYFDSCISASLNQNEKEETIVTFDYTPILPVAKSSFRNPSITNEIRAIQAIIQTYECHHLLKHPLISSFLYIKWHRMRWFFYSNLALVITLWVTLAAFIMLSNEKNALFYLAKSILILSYLLIVARECFQVAVLKMDYVLKLSNWFEIFLVIVCFFVIFPPPTTLHKQLCAFSILSVVLELGMLVKGHPKSSVYIIMLQTVTKTFFHFLISYSILLVAFALTFYNLFDRPDSVDAEDRSFLEEILLSLFRTVLMMTGELNASSYILETWIHKLFYVLFVLFVPIILFNLLCGLAVCDVGMIRDRAEIMSYIEIVKFIAYTEKYVATIIDFFPKLGFLKSKLFLCPYYLKDKKISILLGDTENERVPMELRTIKRIKQLLFQNNNKCIIQDLQTIWRKREAIRRLHSIREFLKNTSRHTLKDI